MPRSVTVIITRVDTGQHATVEFRTNGQSWTKAELGGESNVFHAKKGSYRVLGASTEMLSVGAFRVARLENIDPETTPNLQHGSGISDDVGSAVTWKVDGILNT